jgi:tRNA(Arg) A34 adenosine deaminase TadA
MTHGNHPFGAILVDQNGKVLLEAENGYMPSHDGTAHAERLLATQACTTIDGNILRSATLYSSAEPCAMCAGAIYWAGIGRLVYGLSEHRLREFTGNHPENPTLDLPCREVFGADSDRPKWSARCWRTRPRRVHRGLDEIAQRRASFGLMGFVAHPTSSGTALSSLTRTNHFNTKKMAPRGTSRRHRFSPGERSGGQNFTVTPE